MNTKTSTARVANFAQLSVTLDIAYEARPPSDTPNVQAWVVEQLNQQPRI